YHEPAFKNAFECSPNQCSDQALSIYLGWRGFKEKCSQSTVDGIQVAFKLMWNDADGSGTFHRKWHYNEVHGQYEGNPVESVDVSDTVVSIRHKINAV
ncbi:hypothetical protein SCLCIDRAFT_1172537, partial [Scleroderma citrinum Foug A]